MNLVIFVNKERVGVSANVIEQNKMFFGLNERSSIPLFCAEINVFFSIFLIFHNNIAML